MLDRLEDGLNHERMFIANASHELRMPLAVLKAELEVSLRERGGEHALREAMGSAVEETDRIIKLAEDLLLLARAEDGTLPIDAHDLTVEELLVELGARFSPVFERAGRSLEVDVESVPAGTAVRADPDRIEQAVANLLDNTLRYGAGPTTLGARVDGRRRRDPRDRPAALASASSSSRTRSIASAAAIPPVAEAASGSGLAIVRTIAQAHGGDAGAGDLPGGGADAWISLPAAAAARRVARARPRVGPGRSAERSPAGSSRCPGWWRRGRR